jgi:hypothetical protein
MRIRAHLPAVALFAVLTLAWSFPLVLHLGTHVPGGGAGDNVSFVWNLWWMRTAWQHHLNPFYTTYLFAPVGVDLTQHTHTALNGAIATTLLAGLSPVAAQNVLLLLSLFANGLVAYLLAHQISGSRYAAIVAGIAFGGAAPVLVRLQGHFNLVGAWVIALCALMFVRAARRQSTRAYLAVGCALAVTAYCDYYYLIYSLVFVAISLVQRWWDGRIETARRPLHFLRRCVLALLVVDLALLVTILLSGGFTVWIGGVRVSMLKTFNVLVAFWALLGVWVFSHWRVSVVARARPDVDVKAELRAVAMMAAGFVVFALPLVVAAARLLYRGDYTVQHYFWRSAPAGVDLAAFIVGNPSNVLYGSLTHGAYSAIGMNPIEGVAWITPVAVVIVLAGWRLCNGPEARRWRAAALVFGVWSLGPHLDVFGTNPGVVLPAAFIRFVPLVSNARVPGRAIVVVALAVAMLLALALARLAPDWSRRRKVLVVVLLLLDTATVPLPLYRPPANAVYSVLGKLPATGTVLEIPLGLRDGLGEIGRFDAGTLFYQTISEKPMLGGFIARLPERVKSWYQHAPVISAVLQLSDPRCPSDWSPEPVTAHQAYDALTAASVRYVVLNRASSSPRLLAYVSSWPMTRVAADSGRELYVLRKP